MWFQPLRGVWVDLKWLEVRFTSASAVALQPQFSLSLPQASKKFYVNPPVAAQPRTTKREHEVLARRLRVGRGDLGNQGGGHLNSLESVDQEEGIDVVKQGGV